jgi:hypothetical protein
MRHIIPILAAGLALGCLNDSPTAPTGLARKLVTAGGSGCYTVSGNINQTGQFPSFSGTISGDIEGDVSTQLDPAALTVAGRVYLTSGEQAWQVTGGNVPDLVGRTLRLTLQSEIVFAQPPVAQNNTTARVIDGATGGDLTYHGTLIASPPPPFPNSVEYRGVICP